ncbi:MAG: chemotaxis protein CheB [Alphaproteobacteria bacterium]|nr:chemotaxis protein CheB [Alphaproteobacteria bacterium]
MAQVIVIGGSQGGVQALRTIIGSLPADFAIPILAVQHIGAVSSILPSVLNDVGGPRADFACQGEPIEPGRVYVAPPDRHLLLKSGACELTRGPRENWSRPAIDPLFRSAARYYAADAIGILLSGRLNDGTAGLYEIKRQGGVAIVQTPAEAEAPDMPQSALDNVKIDYCLPVAEIPRMLLRFADAPRREPKISSGVSAMEDTVLSQPTAQTCPECGGAMRQEEVGSLTTFRCHIGHVMTAEVLAARQLEALQDEIASLLRGLNERAALCRDLMNKHLAAGRGQLAAQWERAAEEAEKRERAVKTMTQTDWAHPETREEAAE